MEFSRKAPSFYESTDVNQLICDMQDMLEKTLTPRIKLILNLKENLWDVWLDKGRLDDCILNLCINAFHAMPDGGALVINTKNIHHADMDVHINDISPGDFVLLSVIDSGSGMSKDVQEKMFDPFFTTKGEKGTGLGLSQVYGFIQQIGGHVQVISVPGKGTRIDIYIPRYQVSEAGQLEDSTDETEDFPSGDETILVVDDETALLELAEMILTTYGYNVICSESGEQALKILNSHSVDLLLTDVIMPGMDGYQLVSAVKEKYPEVKIQIVSGFVEEDGVSKVGEIIHKNRLHKPYNAEELLKRVRTLLDEDK